MSLIPSKELIKLEAKVKVTRFTMHVAFIVGVVSFLYLFHNFMDGDLVQFFTRLDTIFIVFPPFIPTFFMYLRLRGVEKKYYKTLEKESEQVAETQ